MTQQINYVYENQNLEVKVINPNEKGTGKAFGIERDRENYLLGRLQEIRGANKEVRITDLIAQISRDCKSINELAFISFVIGVECHVKRDIGHIVKAHSLDPAQFLHKMLGVMDDRAEELNVIAYEAMMSTEGTVASAMEIASRQCATANESALCCYAMGVLNEKLAQQHGESSVVIPNHKITGTGGDA